MSSFHTSVKGDESDTGSLCVLFPSPRPLTTVALLLCEWAQWRTTSQAHVARRSPHTVFEKEDWGKCTLSRPTAQKFVVVVVEVTVYLETAQWNPTSATFPLPHLFLQTPSFTTETLTAHIGHYGKWSTAALVVIFFIHHKQQRLQQQKMDINFKSFTTWQISVDIYCENSSSRSDTEFMWDHTHCFLWIWNKILLNTPQ